MYLYNGLRQFEVVKYSKYNVKEVLPPGGVVEVTIGLHDLEHYC